MASPMLLYEQRTIRKLLARNVLSDARTGRYSETDESVVIPADYQGELSYMSEYLFLEIVCENKGPVTHFRGPIPPLYFFQLCIVLVFLQIGAICANNRTINTPFTQ